LTSRPPSVPLVCAAGPRLRRLAPLREGRGRRLGPGNGWVRGARRAVVQLRHAGDTLPYRSAEQCSAINVWTCQVAA